MLLAAACLLLLAEGRVFYSGLVDFPFYAKDSGLGYFPAPKQSGRFLNKNARVFNDRSMVDKIAVWPIAAGAWSNVNQCV